LTNISFRVTLGISFMLSCNKNYKKECLKILRFPGINTTYNKLREIVLKY
jgi:hypothetical protein